MQYLSYYVILILTKISFIIPFPILYATSYIFYLLLYYVIPYRKKIIRQNIERSFPELSAAEHKKIIKGFYKNLSHVFLEAIKGFTISRKSLIKRYKFLNPEAMDELFEKGEDIIAIGSHYANWEWGILAAPIQMRYKIYAFYNRLTNAPIDAYMRRNRNRFGTELIQKRHIKKAFDTQDDIPVCYFFGADQSPALPKGAHWMQFLNQDTCCVRGPEVFARRYRLPVVYFDVQRVKRGYYTVELKIIETDPLNTEPGEITEKYMRTLEQIVKNKPEDFLWSHRRWKHQRQPSK